MTAATFRHPMGAKLTRDAEPERDDSRRTAFANRGDVCHRWAANVAYEGRAGNVFFRGATIFSYGSHFPMARHCIGPRGRKFILFTSRSYSSTTAGHKSLTRRAIPDGAALFIVDNVLADRRGEHLANFNALRDEAAELFVKAKRARANRDYYLASAAGLVTRANEYAEAVGLSQRLPVSEDGNAPAWLAELMADKERADKAAAALQRKRDKERAAALASEVAEWEQKLAAWRDGGDWPGYHPLGHDYNRPVPLRVKGSCLETLERAVVPLRLALPLLAVIRDPAGTIKIPPGCRIGDYELTEFDREAGTLKIGCHLITFAEVLQLAEREGY